MVINHDVIYTEILHNIETSQNINLNLLIQIIKNTINNNPYGNNFNNSNNNNTSSSSSIKTKSLMWLEQSIINFPLLYLASIYLYIYANKKGCNTFLFATRDCCHWYKIFTALFPNTNSHYFNCSRNMFEKATNNTNIEFKNYIKSIVQNVDKTIFIDIHGTGKRMVRYFSNEFDDIPYCFLLSATFSSYSDFPYDVQEQISKEKLINLVFDTAGSPIEMLNYDNIGTLVDYVSFIGPVREPLEYNKRLILPYHECINYIIKQITPLNYQIDKQTRNFSSKELHSLIDKIFSVIKYDKPILSQYIKHMGKHKKQYRKLNNKKIDIDVINTVKFKKIISDTSTYGIVWKGKLDGKSCAIKMVMLDTGITPKYVKKYSKHFKDNDKDPFRHNDFYHKKPLCIDKFKKEAEIMTELASLGIVPEVYACWVNNTLFQIHYGFIVMEKVDYSLKDILLKRNLTKKEEDLVQEYIDKLHNYYGIVHGDMKPSNIGVYLGNNMQINKCLFLDCGKVKYKDNMSIDEFRKLVSKDWNNYWSHLDKNKQYNRKILN